MTKEALKLALEALEGVLDNSPKVLDASISGGLYEVVQCRDAITAIKEALAPTSTQCEVQPEQEPVAQRKPLTDEAIYAMCDDFHNWSEWDGGEYQRLWLTLCRAIEAAHDIKEIT